ncbi:MAG: hypothetical protein HY958_13255, partial [Bacteroidia bacterium]|nr:hypothetical protein [Bacteroidia bacterium]
MENRIINETESRICPYPGLRPFTEDESLYFKGRESHTEKILELLNKNKFLMLTGASGDGKSSMVYAGLIPNIKAGFFKVKFGKWAIVDFRPCNKPLASMANCLTPVLKYSDPDLILNSISLGYSALIDLYVNSSLYLDEKSKEYEGIDEKEQRKARNKASNLLLIVDQFEELFSTREDYNRGQLSQQAKNFVNLLVETNNLALKNDIPIYIICTMRSDFIGLCAEFSGLPELIGNSHYFIPRLKRKEIFYVIEEPSILSGNRISVRLVEQLLYDLKAGMNVLPVLQHALFRIWKMALDDGAEQMDLIHYAKIGGKAAEELPEEDREKYEKWYAPLPQYKKNLLKNSSIENILDAHANELFETAHELYNNEHPEKKISKDLSQEIIKSAFYCLTRINDGKAVRNRMTLSEITDTIGKPGITNEVVADVLKIYAAPENSLFRPFQPESSSGSKEQSNTEHRTPNTEHLPASQQAGQTSNLKPETLLDISHEALIRNWKRLNDWAEEENDSAEIFHDFLTQINRWKNNRESKAYLLSSGQFNYFNEWNKRQNPTEAWIKRYICHTNLETEEEKQKACSEAREVKKDIQRFLSKCADNINRKEKANKLAFALISILLVLSVVALFWAFKQNSLIEIQRKIAKSNEIATRALIEAERLPTLSFGLAKEAYNIYPTIQAKQALIETSAGNPFYFTFKGHSGRINHTEFSNNDNKVVSASEDRTIRIWNCKGKSIHILTGHNERVLTAMFNKTDKYILSASYDKTAKLWDTTGACLITFAAHTQKVNNAVFSPDEKFILTCSDDSTAILWSIDGKQISKIIHKGAVNNAYFTSDGKNIITASFDNTVKIWDLNGNLISSIPAPAYDKQIAALSDDGKLILCNGENYSLVLYDLKGKKVKELNNLTSYSTAACFADNASTIIAGFKTGMLVIWDFKNNNFKKINDIPSKISNLEYNKNKQNFVASADVEFVYVYDLNGNILLKLKQPELIYHINYSNDGNYILVGSYPEINLFYTNIEKSILIGHRDYVRSCCFSPDGKYFATASYDNTACLWDIYGNLLQTFIGHNDILRSINFSIDNKTIVTSSYDKTARLWGIDGKCIAVLEHQDKVNSAIFSPDGKCIATACYDGSIGLWDKNGKILKMLKEHSGPVMCIAFSPDNKYLASGSGDKSLIIWDVSAPLNTGSNGKFIRKITKFNESLYKINFSSDSKYIGIGCNDGQALVLGIDGNVVTELKGHKKLVSYIEFSSDNKTI